MKLVTRRETPVLATHSMVSGNVADDDAVDVARRYVGELGADVALVTVSERMVAITQGRSHPMSEIRPGRLARFLVRFVTRPGYGIGLGTAETQVHEPFRGGRPA